MNKAISMEMWIELYLSFMDFPLTIFDYTGNYRISYMGKPVIYKDDLVIIFDKCEYCNHEDRGLKEGLYGEVYCTHCGATISYTKLKSLKEV